MKKEKTTIEMIIEVSDKIANDALAMIENCGELWALIDADNSLHMIALASSKLTYTVPVVFRKIEALRVAETYINKYRDYHDLEKYGEYPRIGYIYDCMDDAHFREIIKYLELEDILP